MGFKPTWLSTNKISLPNAGEKTQTPSTLRIDLHYEMLGIYRRWNWERFSRLAAFLNVTPYELGSTACITHKQVTAFKEKNRLLLAARVPHRAAALLLTVIEWNACKEFTNDVIANPFPNLTKTDDAQP